MSLDNLKTALPDYAKDIRLNLGSLATEPSLSDEQRAGTFVVSAIASRNPSVTEEIIAEFGPRLSPEALNAAKAAAAIMAMKAAHRSPNLWINGPGRKAWAPAWARPNRARDTPTISVDQ